MTALFIHFIYLYDEREPKTTILYIRFALSTTKKIRELLTNPRICY